MNYLFLLKILIRLIEGFMLLFSSRKIADPLCDFVDVYVPCSITCCLSEFRSIMSYDCVWVWIL